MSRLIDDRNPLQKTTHNVLIAATDKFMSGWGMATGGSSFVAWACRPKDAPRVEAWVRNRPEMIRVRRVAKNWRGARAAQVHIYVVNDNHPALD